MRLTVQSSRISQPVLLGIFLLNSGVETRLAEQSTYTAQLAAVVTDGTKYGDTMQFELSPVERGAVAWVVGS